MDQPKFVVGQKVKLIGDKMAGNILSFTYDSIDGYTYKVSSKAYDATQLDMIEGVMTCKEAELEVFEGEITPEKEEPTHSVDLSEKVNEEKAVEETVADAATENPTPAEGETHE